MNCFEVVLWGGFATSIGLALLAIFEPDKNKAAK